MVPHSWIKEYFELFGVAENIKTLLVNSMEEWKLTLCAKNSELREVYIKQGIFQGDSVSINCLKIKNDVCSSTSWHKTILHLINVHLLSYQVLNTYLSYF